MQVTVASAVEMYQKVMGQIDCNANLQQSAAIPGAMSLSLSKIEHNMEIVSNFTLGLLA